MKKRFLFIISILVISSISITLLSTEASNVTKDTSAIDKTAIPTPPDDSTFTPQYETTELIDYNGYYAVWFIAEVGTTYKHEWAFLGSNSFVGITLLVMSDYNFGRFDDGYSYVTEDTLSDGSYYGHSGEWYPSYSDVWCFVFWNKDSDVQSTTVDITLNLIEIGDIDVDNVQSEYDTSDNIAITWDTTYDATTDPISNVKIELFRSSTLDSVIIASTSNDGSYSWAIPDGISARSDYSIRVSSASESEHVYDTTNTFEIKQWSEISDDTEASAVKLGNEMEIAWSTTYHGSSNPNPYVRLELYDGTTQVLTIESSTQNDGSYTWIIPDDAETLPPGDYRIKITSTSDSDIYIYTDTFSIKKPFPIGLVIGLIGGVVGVAILAIIIPKIAKSQREKKEREAATRPVTPAQPAKEDTIVTESVISSKTPSKATPTTDKKQLFFCPNCGASLIDVDQFCRECGAKIKPEDKVAVDTPQVDLGDVGKTTSYGKPSNLGAQIAWMIFVTLVQIVGLIMAAISYSRKDKEKGMVYLLCGLSGVCLAVGWLGDIAGILSGVVITLSSWATGFRMISSGKVKFF